MRFLICLILLVFSWFAVSAGVLFDHEAHELTRFFAIPVFATAYFCYAISFVWLVCAVGALFGFNQDLLD